MVNSLTQRAPARCEVVSDFSRLLELIPEWTRLWKSDPQAEVFQTPEWAIAWWHAFGHHHTLCTLVVFSGEEVIGIVPLVKRDGVIQFLGAPEADYADIICADQWAAEVLAIALETLRKSVAGWSECVWQHLSEDSRVMRHYRQLPRRLRNNFHPLGTENYQTILLTGERDAIFSSLLAKKHTRRRINKLRKAGDVQLRELSLPEVEPCFDDFFRHHVRRHAAIGKQSCYAEHDDRQFLKALFAELGSQARFGVLELEGQPLAWYLGFEVNGKFLLYQHTFDLDASEYTPGESLLWFLFDNAKDRVEREFDFGKGNEPYKTRFTNHSRETYLLFIEPRGVVGRARGLARSAQAYLHPHLLDIRLAAKSHRPTLRAFRSARIWASGLLSWAQLTKSSQPGGAVLHLKEERSKTSALAKGFSRVLASRSFSRDEESRVIAASKSHSASGSRA
jgi:CelD/BcsL family acetyltransferase involved in cellulose biosynthesis